MRFLRLVTFLVSAALVTSACNRGGSAPSTEVKIPRGAGGVGFLPLLVMEKRGLIEKHAAALGIPDLKPKWIELGGPDILNGALLSGAIDFAAAGPPAFLILWDATGDKQKVMGVAAMTSLPMYLNTTNDQLKTLEDFKDNNKIGVTAIEVSIPAIAMQMYAAEKYGMPQAKRFDGLTRQMTHGDGWQALLGGSLSAHFTSPPFHQRERKDPRVHTIMTTDDIMKGSTTFTMLYTTTAFHENNPIVVKVVLAALEEANALIRDDIKTVAEMVRGSTTEIGFTADELLEVVSDPAVKFTTTPENIMKYADFMHLRKTIKKKPANWQELFFPEIHEAPGS